MQILFVQKCKINRQLWTAANVTKPIYSFIPISQGRAVAPKTVMCQYEGCGKTFCHSFHLYRHQREKHGQQYKYNKPSWQAAHLLCCYHSHIIRAHDFLQSAESCFSPQNFGKCSVVDLRCHKRNLSSAMAHIVLTNIQ